MECQSTSESGSPRPRRCSATQAAGDDACEAKWRPIVEDEGVRPYRQRRPEQFRRRLRRGVPPRYRWDVWAALMHLDEYAGPALDDASFEALVEADSPWTRSICTDVTRTFTDDAAFGEREQTRLRRVLCAYASHNPDLGYCQGMNFVAGLLLAVAGPKRTDREVFCVFVVLMEQIGLAGFYSDSLPLLRRYLRAHDLLLEQYVPALRQHLIKQRVLPIMYLHQWFLTLFVNAFPRPVVLNIWDAVIAEGFPVVLRLAVTLLMVMQHHLLAMEMEDIISFLKLMRSPGANAGEVSSSKIGYMLLRDMDEIELSDALLQYLDDDACDGDLELQPRDEDVGWLASLSRTLQRNVDNTVRAATAVLGGAMSGSR
eukprot:TRINITY_DN72058_c0_g1_i1.p1 TRINITY_DN72058_c0_g1~~TRINITY_DN72058_c0_g1_i1.p1  ORF type:complete len:371 (+),score=92.25 TRINITY_DN72058_c0_g1_i1:116-1228(+)